MDESKKHFLACIALIIVCLQLVSCNARAEDFIYGATLSIKPNRCVALHEGQDCYQGIAVRWSSERVGHYCLFEGDTQQALKCWEESNEGVFRYDFQSNKSVPIVLMAMPGKSLVAHRDMRVAWVYKARKRQRLNWRLF